MVQKQVFTFPSASKANVDIFAYEYRDDAIAPVGVVQLTHGLSEYIEAFEELATFLAEHGYIVIGMDLLGHGRTAGGGCVGITPNDTNKAVWKDMLRLYSICRERYPLLPQFSYSHSMGSTMWRAFLVKYRDQIDFKACFFSADSAMPSLGFLLVPVAHVIGRVLSPWPKAMERRKQKWTPVRYEGEPPLIRRILFSWLSFDHDHVREFINSPYTLGANGTVANVVGFVTKALTTFVLGDKLGWEKKMPEDTALFHGCGKWDLPGVFGHGPTSLHRTLTKAGKKTELKLYPNARHEPFGEANVKEEFRQDMLDFFDRNNPLRTV